MLGTRVGAKAPRLGRRAAVAVAALAVAAAAAPASGEGSFTLTPVRVVGGPGHAGLYAWGAATTGDGSVLISDYWNRRVQHYNTDGTLRRTAVAYDVNHEAPYDVAVDRRDDSVYIGDVDLGHDVDKYDRDGNYLYSFGGADLKYPAWLDVDHTGRVAVVDSRANRIVVFDDRGVKLFAFGAFGTAAGQFKTPRGAGFDAAGLLYVADSGNQRIQVFSLGAAGATPVRQWKLTGDFRGLTVDAAGGFVYVVNGATGLTHQFDRNGVALGAFGGFGTGRGKFVEGGRGATVDGNGNVWVSDMPGFRAQVFSPAGQFVLAAPDPAEPPPPGGFLQPSSVALDAAGNIVVQDTFNWRIQRLRPDGTFERQWGHRGGGAMGFNYGRGVAVDQRDGTVVVADTDNGFVKKYGPKGANQWILKGVKAFAVDVATDGTIYAAEFEKGRVAVISPTGELLRTFGEGELADNRGVDVDPDGSVWVSSRGHHSVRHFGADGTFLGEIGRKGPGPDQLTAPADIETDATYLYVADQEQNRIKVWRKTGEFVGSFGEGGEGLGRLMGPVGLHLTAAGRLYVAEFDNERIQEFSVNGS